MYQVTIKGKGAMVDAFREEGIFVTFGDNAPDTLKDFCYSIDVNPVAICMEKAELPALDIGSTIAIVK